MSGAAISSPFARLRNPSVLPGFGLTLGFTLFYLSVIVLIPLTALLLKPWALGWSGFIAAITEPRVLSALKLSFGGAAIAALVNAVFGLIVAWSLVRYRFPGKRLVDALVDLPFALPTAVAGIALSALYASNGWLGGPLSLLNIKIAFTRSTRFMGSSARWITASAPMRSRPAADAESTVIVAQRRRNVTRHFCAINGCLRGSWRHPSRRSSWSASWCCRR